MHHALRRGESIVFPAVLLLGLLLVCPNHLWHERLVVVAHADTLIALGEVCGHALPDGGEPNDTKIAG